MRRLENQTTTRLLVLNDSEYLYQVNASVKKKAVARFAERDEAVVGQTDSALVAVEEPLEIRINGEAYAVTMRTPGKDRELVAGYLFSEGVLKCRAEVGRLAHCHSGGRTDSNVVDYVPAAGLVVDVESGRRQNFSNSACGVCGRGGIDDLEKRLQGVQPARVKVSVEELLVAGRELSTRGSFRHSGGVHAAAVLGNCREIAEVYEDVGRHNAVDKAVGASLLAGTLPLRDQVLVVTSRASFEIVQKAALAGLAGVACFSAPTSLAIETANRVGLTLVGFLREDSCNVYSGELLGGQSELCM